MKAAVFHFPEVAMPKGDRPQGYGAAIRTLHWLTAIMVGCNIALGLYAGGLPTGNDAEVARAALAYSAHKTIGVSLLGLTLLRIGVALSGPRPAPLHPERRIETLAAATVHWALYGALLVMPAAGWIAHAANTGFAPILWPFGQSLPLVTKSESLVHAFDAVHRAGAWTLYGALALHVAGALKHALIDRDATLARMTRPIRNAAPAAPPSPNPVAAPALIAALLWAGVIATGLSLGLREVAAPGASVSAATGGNWAVTDGSLTFSVRQLGSPVEGRLSGWSAAIAFDEGTGTGNARVTIPLAPQPDGAAERGLRLGAVTAQALGPEFFDAAAHPEAVFAADIAPATDPADTAGGATHLATGSLSLRGTSVPVTLPFALTINGAEATMSGAVTLDRRDFGMGPGYPDETSVGFAVTVTVALTATRI